jgi:hypothetical protein
MIETYFSEICICERYRPRRSHEISCVVKNQADRADRHGMRNWLNRILAATDAPGTEAHLTIRDPRSRVFNDVGQGRSTRWHNDLLAPGSNLSAF